MQNAILKEIKESWTRLIVPTMSFKVKGKNHRKFVSPVLTKSQGL